jgi:hypothetical protein
MCCQNLLVLFRSVPSIFKYAMASGSLDLDPCGVIRSVLRLHSSQAIAGFTSRISGTARHRLAWTDVVRASRHNILSVHQERTKVELGLYKQMESFFCRAWVTVKRDKISYESRKNCSVENQSTNKVSSPGWNFHLGTAEELQIQAPHLLSSCPGASNCRELYHKHGTIIVRSEQVLLPSVVSLLTGHEYF